MDRLIVVSTDSHAAALPEAYIPYLDPKYRSEYDEYVRTFNPHTHFDTPYEDGGGVHSREAIMEYRGRDGVMDDVPGGTAGQWDSAIRTEQLEADGVAAEVLFPNSSPFTILGISVVPWMTVDMLAAGKKAYNRWLAEFCAELPGRRAGMAQIPLHDCDAAIAELEWAANNGLKGALLPFGNNIDLPLYDKSLDRFWSAAEDLGMTTTLHAGPGLEMPRPIEDKFLRIAINVTEIRWLCQRQIWFMMWSGAFERHPKLKLAITEDGCDWVPGLLEWLDHMYGTKTFAYSRDMLPHPPSYYWYRQCFIGASGLSLKEVEMREAIGINNIMYGVDYPHVEGSWPYTKEWLQATLGGLPEHEIRRIAGENAIDVYGFDRSLLQSVANRIGPEIDEFKVRKPTENISQLALLR